MSYVRECWEVGCLMILLKLNVGSTQPEKRQTFGTYQFNPRSREQRLSWYSRSLSLVKATWIESSLVALTVYHVLSCYNSLNTRLSVYKGIDLHVFVVWVIVIHVGNMEVLENWTGFYTAPVPDCDVLVWRKTDILLLHLIAFGTHIIWRGNEKKSG